MVQLHLRIYLRYGRNKLLKYSNFNRSQGIIPNFKTHFRLSAEWFPLIWLSWKCQIMNRLQWLKGTRAKLRRQVDRWYNKWVSQIIFVKMEWSCTMRWWSPSLSTYVTNLHTIVALALSEGLPRWGKVLG